MTERLLDRKKKEAPIEGPRGGYAEQRLSLAVSKAIEYELGLESSGIRLKETPEDKPGDYGLHLGSLARILKVDEFDLASTLATKLSNEKSSISVVRSAQAIGAFLNVDLRMSVFGNAVVDEVLTMGKDYGRENIGQGEVVVIDTSSPNIAKQMSFGHLRSTIIGEAIAKIYEKLGYAEITDNHLGDWGTQFGKQMAAIEKWSNENEISQSESPIAILQSLYVKYESLISKEKSEAFIKKVRDKDKDALEKLGNAISKEKLEAIWSEDLSDIEIRESLGKAKEKFPDQEKFAKELEKYVDGMFSESEVKGRNWFLKLEHGDSDARRIWKMCVDLSLKEFQSVYSILNVDFDLVLGESFYESMLKDTVDFARKSPYVRESEGALIYDLPKTNKKGKPTGEREIVPILTSDGRTLYVTRDFATVKYRQDVLKASEILYVVGADQKDYFRTFFNILKVSNMPVAEKCTHVYFGMVTLPEGKMSTREGRTVPLKDVIVEGIKRARETFTELVGKNEELRKKIENKSIDPEKIIKIIAVGALKWNDLSQNPTNGIVFDWDEAVRLDGNSSPYVQYAAVRAKSILENAGTSLEKAKNINFDPNDKCYATDQEKKLIKALGKYNKALKDAQVVKDPSKVASYVYNLAQSFSSFYASNENKVITEQDQNVKNSRLKLVAATYQVIENALNVLGIEIPEAM